MPYHISPNGSAGGCFRLRPSLGGISPLTCTIFDPNIFLIFSKSIFFHISPTSPKKSIMGYGFFSVFGLWHKANSVFTSPKFPPIFQNKNFDLQLFFFRVNITHHEGDFFCFVSCVLQDVSISMKVSGIHSGYFASDQKWIGYTTLAHLVAERCVIPRKMLNS